MWEDNPISYKNINVYSNSKHICVSDNKVDEPRTYYTEWNKSERKYMYI